jgi:hypothetical protein
MSVAKFTIPAEQISSLNNGELPVSEFIKSVINSSAAIKQLLVTEVISDELYAIHGREGGSPEMSGLEIDAEKSSYNLTSHKGKIAYKYNIRFFYGCSGIDRTDAAKDSVEFEIDSENQQIIIQIPGRDVRGTADEF